MPEACAEFDLGLNKRIAIGVKGHKEDLLHLVGELPEAGERRRRDGREHLRPQRLQYLLQPQ